VAKRRALGEVVDVRDAQLVVIHDIWVGYNPHSPVAAVYKLLRGASGDLVGEGRLSTAIAGERVVDIAVTSRATAHFLDAIAGVRVVAGPYEPMQDHTDDYPRIEIVLHVGVRDTREQGGIVLLFTESQGEFNAPWGACVRGEIFSIPDEDVGRALLALRRPLKRAQLDRMVAGDAASAEEPVKALPPSRHAGDTFRTRRGLTVQAAAHLLQLSPTALRSRLQRMARRAVSEAKRDGRAVPPGGFVHIFVQPGAERHPSPVGVVTAWKNGLEWRLEYEPVITP